MSDDEFVIVLGTALAIACVVLVFLGLFWMAAHPYG